jgi:HK97 family phage major capsid protein/HK97 family phage prohead protease
METKTIETGILTRILEVEESTTDAESRTLDISFSSETPVERGFGSEILDHSPESVDLGRLNNAAPVLFNHNIDVPIGVVENARIDGKVGRAQIRFGKSEKANEIFQDVMDGILQNVSVGYSVERMEQTKENPPEYRVVSWNPHELSLVTIPADNSVGLFRDQETRFQTEIIELPKKQKQKMEVEEQERAVDMDAVIKEAGQAEQKRIREIEAYGREHKETELAEQFIKDGKSEGDFAKEILSRIQKRPKEHADIGLTKKEVNRFSWMRLINHMSKPGDEKYRREAEFEIDTCIEAERAAHKAARGYIIPNEVLNDRRIKTAPRYGTRELQAGSGDGANLVPTILDASSFIEFLDNTMVSVRAGATVLRNLDGIIKIPRRDEAITGGWLAESADAGDVTPSYDQVTLQLKTYGLRVDLSRQLRLQSSMDVESLVSREIAMSCALALDKAAMTGDGSSNSPTGAGAQSGVGTVALATINQITWAEAIELQSDVMSANAYFGSLAYAIHPVLAGDAKSRSRDSGSGRYVMENNEIDGFPAFVSAQVADLGASGANNAMFGDWSSMLIGYFSPGIDVMVMKEFADGRTRLVVFVDADTNVRHVGSFSRTSNP